MISELSPAGRKVLNSYLSLPLPGLATNCPYYNNKRKRVRMGLRVEIGKGSPKEIAEEATLYSLKEKVDLSKMTAEQIRSYLVEHNLGIDCSGLAYHILNAEFLSKHNKELGVVLNYPFTNGLLSRLGRYLRGRYAENVDVKTLAHDSNSRPIEYSELKATDILVRLPKNEKDRDHVLLVSKTDDQNIWVGQSVELPSDGRLGHGVREEIFNNATEYQARRLNCLA